ncbi:MAG: electron transfer flavoprotein subunit alpha/FixB family protein [Candidatus Brockarchaeota archaeon]|nr:electron transfer flavoprotein subunit alpha/FixB family protein [Candidatus Brockarchaeota archaeon]
MEGKGSGGKVLVVAELRGEAIHPVTFELLGKGREIVEHTGGELWSVVFGSNVDKAKASELIYYGADRVFLFNDPVFSSLNTMVYAHNLTRLCREEKPDIILIGATCFGRSLGPRVAAALKTGLTADCIDLRIDENGELIQIRPAFVGNILAYIKTKTKPVMSTVRYKVMRAREKDKSRSGLIIEKTAEKSFQDRIRLVGEAIPKKLNIADAEIIVAGGRGLGSAEGFRLLGELASLLGGVVGSSRPPVDDGWIRKEHQVGYSGSIVKPRLYIACGISGSPQHLFGMKDAETIIAINSDPSAPIFRVADYGIVGDLYQIIPLMVKEIKARRSGLG